MVMPLRSGGAVFFCGFCTRWSQRRRGAESFDFSFRNALAGDVSGQLLDVVTCARSCASRCRSDGVPLRYDLLTPERMDGWGSARSRPPPFGPRRITRCDLVSHLQIRHRAQGSPGDARRLSHRVDVSLSGLARAFDACHLGFSPLGSLRSRLTVSPPTQAGALRSRAFGRPAGAPSPTQPLFSEPLLDELGDGRELRRLGVEVGLAARVPRDVRARGGRDVTDPDACGIWGQHCTESGGTRFRTPPQQHELLSMYVSRQRRSRCPR